MAERLCEAQTWILEKYSGIPSHISRKFAEISVNWERAAKQLLFWSQNDQEGYPSYVNWGEVPSGLYDDQLEVSIENGVFAENYSPEEGFGTEGELDIGPMNGPLACIDFEKNLYITALMSIGMEQIYRPIDEESGYFQ